MNYLKACALLLATTVILACSDDDTRNIQQTTEVPLSLNLDPSLNSISEEFSPNDTSTYNTSVTRTIYDSLLKPHELEIFFAKLQSDTFSISPNTWNVYIRIDGVSVADPLDTANSSSATFRLVFLEDGSLSRVLSDTILISNWQPLDQNMNPNGALGPITLSQGATTPIQLPPISSNFVVNTDELIQRASDLARTAQVQPQIELDANAIITANTFDAEDMTTFNQKTSHIIIDSLGIQHTLELFYKRLAGIRNWDIFAKINGEDVGDPDLNIANLPTQASFRVTFEESGDFDTNNSDTGLISNWNPVDQEGRPNGADGPLNVVNGGILPIRQPPVSSNFEIDFSNLSLVDL